ncbi:hypothetical protein SAMN02990966_05162 [Rhodospirillales bacterium URHD0017]|nr:hypothetical protein SAMN02990966_05162 [Rhodospirillales bacterium URHD0017]
MATGSTSTVQTALRFLPEWLESRDGPIVRGRNLSIAFDPTRLTGCRRNWRGTDVWEIEGVVKFHPRGDVVRGTLLEPIRTSGVVTGHSPKALEVTVPSDATQIEVWFHNFAEVGGRCDAWDSRFGQNYWFDVEGPNPIIPQDPVRYREATVANADLVNVIGQTAVKKNVFPAPPRGPRVGKDLRTSLYVQAWVKNIAFAKDVWLDVHVFDRDAARIQAGTFALSWNGSASGFGDLFRFQGEIYKGSTATPGSVSPKPNASLVQYRLYYAVEGTTYTDAILHQLELLDDAVI